MTVGSSPGSDEAFSALIDGELPDTEAEGLIDRMSAEPDLRARWTRYHASRAALAGAVPDRVRPDFARRVEQALAVEPPINGPLARRRIPAWRSTAGSGRIRPVVGFAAAASLATLALAVVLAVRDSGAPEPVRTVERPADAALVDPALAGGSTLMIPRLGPSGLTIAGIPIAPAMAGDRAHPDVPNDQDARDRLDAYLATHAAFSATDDMPGLLQSGRFAGHRANP